MFSCGLVVGVVGGRVGGIVGVLWRGPVVHAHLVDAHGTRWVHEHPWVARRGPDGAPSGVKDHTNVGIANRWKVSAGLPGRVGR